MTSRLSGSKSSSSEKCDLRGDNSTSEFEKRNVNLLGDDVSSDCEFIVGPKKAIIKGHRLIFSAASQVFKAMFFGPFSKSEIIEIKDLDPAGFQGMKQFIYTDDLDFTSTRQASHIYLAARKYLIPHLGDKCIKYIEENMLPSEALELYEFSKINLISKLEEHCSKIIQDEAEEVLETEYFLSIEYQTMDMILSSKSLGLNSEVDLFKHFERWTLAEIDRKTLSEDKIGCYFNSLKKHIRFLTMSGEDFANGPAKSLLLTQEEKLAVGLNIMNFGSTPYPKQLSSLNQERCYKVHKFPVYEATFTIRLDKRTDGHPIYTTNFSHAAGKWYVEVVYSKENIIFIISYPSTLSGATSRLYRVRSKVRVLALRNQCRDLYIENDFYCYIISDSSSSKSFHTAECYECGRNQRAIDKNNTVFAVIPLSTIQKKCFMKNNATIIEFLISIQDIV